MHTRDVFSCPSDPTAGTGMLSFLRAFDPISRKYDFDRFKLSIEARAKVSDFEAMQQFGNLTKHKFSDIRENLELVYWDKDVIRKDVMAYYLVEEKVIHQYLAIPQLDSLFDEDYFDFEWDMHVGQNFNEHRNNYYRDHFIHQIRDMYMMLIMLDKFGFYEASYEILKDRNVGKISDYTYKKWCEFKIKQGFPQRMILNDLIDEITTSTGEERDKEKFEYAEKYFFHYVIYASSMLSALFHDMGYPICHFLEVRHRISDYNPFMYMFTHNAVDSFDELAAKLNDSLLFTIVSSHEIKAALQIGKKGRYNHGVYSAIAFLLQFYENGLLFSLSPEKQCAIELAAVAIYNHTAKYDIIEYRKENNYCWPVFRQNPVSFLLRFCDDLQEWDRRYFEISSASDLIFCPKCGAPMLKDWETGDSCCQYKCLCSDRAMPRPESFVKRKLYLVTVADSIDVILEEKKSKDSNNAQEIEDGGEKNNDKKWFLTVKLNYDLYKLLLLSNINNTYAKYRAEELYDLKRLVSYQDFYFQAKGKLAFRHIKFDYFMSSNPLLIKLKILEKFLAKHGISADPAEGLKSRVLQCLPEMPREEQITGNLPFYMELLRDCQSDKLHDEKYFVDRYAKYLTSDPEYNDALCCLAGDCFVQYQKEISAGHDPFKSKETYDAYSEQYVNPKSEDRLYYAVSLITDQRSRCNHYFTSTTRHDIGYYVDMYLFYLMNEDVKKEDRGEKYEDDKE